ncbi:histidinol dehydrogenase [Arenicella xantha]|uniref:Histidinol dehydrogenase n=1 Tax=Arenicella xantha TaxID=644221 RepID=A0A395JHQ6_9GAMM|nr:histidinol dehydrogenase [Arenicella xantha]RBP49667.1 histidinol dehydrogenase [Arenicella xantha]
MHVAVKKLNSEQENFAAALMTLLNRDQTTEFGIDETVAEVIATVRHRGDAALYLYTRKFDGFDAEARGLEVPRFRLMQALDAIPPKQRDALQYAVDRVTAYHQKQNQQSWSYTEADGTQLGQKITPMQRVGLYVPGGKATYPSSVIMNAVPAKVAGVKELIMVSPTPGGEFNDMVLAAAVLAGVDRVFRVGGAQAIAALAYGTETIPAVDKITGPGNIYVATAKKQVFGKVGIDMIAGPSEVLVIADESVDPDWVAMDLFAQAEHDEIAQSILLTQSELVAERVQQSINRLLPTMERAEIIQQSLKGNGALIVAESRDKLIAIADEIAAEHLEVFTEDADQLAQEITNAGAIFIGPYSAESLGDYCAGPNHVLPTSGTARFSSPLGVYDFQKRTSMIKVSRQGAQSIGENASILARGESLTAHARSAEYRLDDAGANDRVELSKGK